MKEVLLKPRLRILHNVLTEEERLLTLSQFKPFLTNHSDWPGLQTEPNLHILCSGNTELFDCFAKIKQRINTKRRIIKSWVNYTDKQLKYLNWHNHKDANFTCVYMLENPESVGPLVKTRWGVFPYKVPTNSLIILPPKLIHSVPNEVISPRYSLTLDFN